MIVNRLRHIHGPNLKELENILEREIPNYVMVGVNRSGDEWYVHFSLLGDTYYDAENDTKEIKKVNTFEQTRTKTVKQKDKK